MDLNFRRHFNQSFSRSKYHAFLQDIGDLFHYVPDFRIAETPVFIDHSLRDKLVEACRLICAEILQPSFKTLTEGALNDDYRVPGEDDHTQFLQLDFGITKNLNGEFTPRLVEIQGFPTLYFFQDVLARQYRKHFDIPDQSHHLFDRDSDQYIELLREMIVGNCHPENVILLDIEPEKQATRIDFLLTERILGIKVLCISALKKSGRTLYYLDDMGKKIPVHRIYNRVIFDELIHRNDLDREFFLTQEIDAEWVGHPNWFFRISKYSLPLLNNKYVPKTWYLKDLSELPENLEDFVLKPLFSFSGSGVVFNVSREAIERTGNLKNFILQKKVKYEPVIETPGEPVNCEIRMVHLWPKNADRPILVSNLARLSRGDLIGVKYNSDKSWVGGSVGFIMQ